jgi:uncharacterized membrane protein YecN with MAPEG domain
MTLWLQSYLIVSVRFAIHHERPTKARATTCGVTDNLVQIITAQGEGSSTTPDALIDTMAMGLFMKKLFWVLGVPVLFERIRWSDTMAMQAITARGQNVSATLGSVVMASFGLTVCASVIRAVRSWRRSLHVSQEGIDRNPHTKLSWTLLLSIDNRATTIA